MGGRIDQTLGGGGQVPDYFVPAIISTFCCCMPAGIASIVFASRARSNRDTGNIPAALEAAKQARTWLIVAVVAGLAVGGIWILMVMVGAASNSGDGY